MAEKYLSALDADKSGAGRSMWPVGCGFLPGCMTLFPHVAYGSWVLALKGNRKDGWPILFRESAVLQISSTCVVIPSITQCCCFNVSGAVAETEAVRIPIAVLLVSASTSSRSLLGNRLLTPGLVNGLPACRVHPRPRRRSDFFEYRQDFITCGLVASAPASRVMGFLPFVSGLFGWIYTFCWSASFYPQLILNFSRKSTSGTTVDFPFINVIGFVAYFVSNVAFYYSPVIRSQYAARHNDLTPTVQFNDITFALHASVISTITLSQYLLRPSWGFTPSPGTRPGRFIVGVALGCFLGVFATYLVVASAVAKGPIDPATDWCELDIIYAVGYVKLLITLIKFTPQVLANYTNQSTKGWSIWQVTLDFVGGILSTGQQGIDSYLQHDWSGITGNPVKFALGNVSMVYDCIFFAQHYILYRGSLSKDSAEQDALLGDEEQQRRRRLD